MPQEIDTKNLAVVPKDQIVHKSDNEAFVKKVLDILIAKDKKHDQKIEDLGVAFRQLVADLRSQVDGLFVSDRVKKIEDDHGTRMKGVDERMSKVKDGRDGKDGKDGLPGKAGINGNKIKAEEVRDKLESLKGDERLDISAIKGMDKYEKRMKEVEGRPVGGYGGGGSARDFFKEYDISDQLNGVLKTFNIPATWYVLGVEMTSYPYGASQKTTDYTWTPTTITFGDEVSAATQLAAGQKVIVMRVTA